MSHLSDRPLVDDSGHAIHDCSAAIPLSWARFSRARVEGRDPNDGIAPYTISDVTAYYERALKMSNICADCQAEATAGVKAMVARFERSRQ